MTANQLNYQQLLESKRSNLANEEIKRDQNVETKRHNIVTENVSTQSLSESKRHNLATESISTSQLEMEERKLAENIRANKARESQNALEWQGGYILDPYTHQRKWVEGNLALRKQEVDAKKADVEVKKYASDNQLLGNVVKAIVDIIPL